MADPIREALQLLVSDIEFLANHSAGIAGLHKNGDIAPWSTLLENGDFSPWLGDAISAARAALAAQPPAPASDNDSTAIAPLLWALWHHQGARSPVGQAIRRYLGIAQFERLTPEQVALAAQYQDLPPVEAAKSAPEGDPIRAALERALMSISGGLCYFTTEAKHAQLRDAQRDLEDLRAALAAQPPAAAPASDGEREELAAWFQELGAEPDDVVWIEPENLTRAATLLRQPAPAPAAVPVAVAERLPDTTDPAHVWIEPPDSADPDITYMPVGFCWWFNPEEGGAWYWDCMFRPGYTHWAPHWAISIPQPPQGGEVAD